MRLGSFWKQFLKTAGGPIANIADQKYCVKPADISEVLEKAGGKSRPWSKKFVSKNDRIWVRDNKSNPY